MERTLGTEGFSMHAQTIESLISYLKQLPPETDVTCNGSSYFFGYYSEKEKELNFTDELREN